MVEFITCSHLGNISRHLEGICKKSKILSTTDPSEDTKKSGTCCPAGTLFVPDLLASTPRGQVA